MRALVSVAFCLLAVGCGNGAPSTASVTPHPPAPSVPTNVANDPTLRRDVKLTSCGATLNGWAASGSAKNPSDKPRTLTITVFFTTPAATVIATGATRVALAPHRTRGWSVAEKFDAPDETLCVLRGVG